jgi:hypothetical protein
VLEPRGTEAIRSRETRYGAVEVPFRLLAADGQEGHVMTNDVSLESSWDGMEMEEEHGSAKGDSRS